MSGLEHFGLLTVARNLFCQLKHVHRFASVVVALYRLEEQPLTGVHERGRVDYRVLVYLLTVHELKQLVINGFKIPLGIADQAHLLLTLDREIYLELKPKLLPNEGWAV